MKYRLLKIDLTGRSFEIEELQKEIIRKYVGGRGLGAYLLYRSVPAKADPLGPKNHLIFSAGPASGTGLFYSSKVCVSTKSPLTGIYLYSIASGLLAQQMRKAAFWAIDIYGKADEPVFLEIADDNVRFRKAYHLWGMETATAQEAMLDAASGNEATVGIGPAGEQLNPYAATYTEGRMYRCFGRGGSGAVMGSKNLKGMIVAGSKPVEIGDSQKLEPLKKKIAGLLKNDFRKWADGWRRFETSADLKIMNDLGLMPTRNWQTGQFEGWRGIDKSTTPMGWPEKARSCAPYCPSPGCRNVEVKAGPYKGYHSDIEWETVYAFGCNCGVDKMEAVIAASQICDEYGVDTMTAGITIGFAMECFEKGMINTDDTDGIELRFGNDEAMIEVLKKLTKQEGFGRELAKGSRRLSRKIKGSEAFAMHAKGMEFGGYECRGANGQALQFAIDTRGGCHHGYGLPARTEMFDGTRLEVAGKGEYVKKAAISRIVRDSMIVCTFAPLYGDELIADTLAALFGDSWTAADVKEAGERSMCLERMFNIREGLSAENDTLPDRLLKEPKPDGPTQGEVVPLEALKKDYYEAMGYDSVTGNPTDSLISRLGIEK